MSTPSPESFQPFLTDDEALSWFASRRGGGFLYDEHMSFITEIFGSDISTRHRASVDPSTGEPTVLIIEIMRPADDDESWHQLIQVQAELLERAPAYAAPDAAKTFRSRARRVNPPPWRNRIRWLRALNPPW